MPVFYYELCCNLFFIFMIKSPSVWLSRCSGVNITRRSAGGNQSHGRLMIRPISSVWAAGQTRRRRCSSHRSVGACPFSVRDKSDQLNLLWVYLTPGGHRNHSLITFNNVWRRGDTERLHYCVCAEIWLFFVMIAPLQNFIFRKNIYL